MDSRNIYEEHKRCCQNLNIQPTHTLCVGFFDQSSCHRAFAEDALNVKHMNVRPGGAQSRMRDTVWARQVQKTVLADGTPKGMKTILEERAINISSMKADDMYRGGRGFEGPS